MERKQTVLIAEDNDINRRILVNMLREDYEMLEAGDGEETITLLEANKDHISALLLDIVMPIKTGYDVLQYMAQHDITDIPIVVMTGESDERSEEKALDLGAWDFISKPYKPRVLLTRLKNAIARSQINYLAQVKHIAEHDQLTGLYNRRHFFETCETMQYLHKGEPMAFIRMDINQFRLVNSFLGEKGGNLLLQFCAREIQKLSEGYPWSCYGRLESDVFVFCIPFDKERCEKDLLELTKKLAEYNKEYLIEPSFGIYCITDAMISSEQMYLCASVAAKECKNKYMMFLCYYDAKMSEQLQLEREITHEMQQALDDEQFLVYFQPKYNAQTKTPYGAEALVRWKHPKKGMISPGAFIPVFERNGFIGKLDYYVWEKTCSYLKKWLDEGLEPAPVSVNMSRAELTNPNLVDMIISMVKKIGIPSRLLHLELTESAYMDNPELMNDVISRLHGAGFTILMDDFGSGYSSLNTLKDINVDILKVDMKFLSLDENNTRSKKILASVVTMAQWLGIPVITEGVETEEQYHFLQSIGCEYIQGYYFAKPMCLDEYEELIRDCKPVEAKYSSRADEEYMIPSLLKEKIYKDDLTGAYNRRYLKEWLFLDLAESKEKDFPLAVVLLDLTSFKHVNDLEGHLVGDEILIEVGKILLSHTRKNDAVIRYGGDEFIIIFTNCSEQVVQRKIGELDKAISQISLPAEHMSMGADFGYSYTSDFKKDTELLKSMIRQADKEMYQHKKVNKR
ncbi:MAG: EAL domain-containing protein [Lachnospiraceae bacterium]|nr:EAL domain-containing protein [Lachnospiraceae bacterium]